MGNSDITETLLFFIIAIASTSSLIAVSAFIFLAVRGNNTTLLSANVKRLTRVSVVTTAIPWRPRRHLSWTQRIFLLMAAIGFIFCLYKGAETMLFWMPDNWVQFSDGEGFNPVKSIVAGLFALIGGVILFQYIINSTRMSLRLRLAEMQISLERQIHDAGSQEALNSLQSAFVEKMDELKLTASDNLEPNRPIVAADLELEMYRDLANRAEKIQRRRR